jgi:hypothetical protein
MSTDPNAVYDFPTEDLGVLFEQTISYLSELLGAIINTPQPEVLEEKALWVWALTLGTLANDLAESAKRSIEFGDLRAALLISRALYEYVNRLRYYKLHRAKAVKHSQEGWKFYERMHEVFVSDYLDDLPPLKKENKIDLQSITGMLTEYFKVADGIVPETAARFRHHFHDGFYAVASAVAHGSQGSISEVFRIVEAYGAAGQKVEWRKRRDPRLKPVALFNVSLLLILLVVEIEQLNLTGDRPQVAGEFLDRLRAFHEPLLTLKNQHAEVVGMFQMAIDTMGT